MSPRRDKPIIRLWAVAGSCDTLLTSLGCRDAADLIELIQSAVGDRYRVSGSRAQIEASEDDRHGGRDDDAARAKEIQTTLADDRVAAAVALRGGAWLTRILPRIDFGVLERRKNRIALFGFSELTPLLNIAAQYKKVYAYHDYCPSFIITGKMAFARDNFADLRPGRAPNKATLDAFAKRWAEKHFRGAFANFFVDVVNIIEGRGSDRSLTLDWLSKPRQAVNRLCVVGGNLTTLTTLLPSRWQGALRPNNRWLLIEDIRESPERIDRLLSHLSLSGRLQRFAGIVVGVFRDQSGDCTPAAVECLERHLGNAAVPILMTKQVGHIWPMSPIPLARSFELRRAGFARPFKSSGRARPTLLSAVIPWHRWRIVD